MIDDEKIIEMFFERDQQAIQELDIKYGKICHNLSYNIVNSKQDAEEYFPQNLLEIGSSQTKRTLQDCLRGNRGLYRRPENRGR